MAALRLIPFSADYITNIAAFEFPTGTGLPSDARPNFGMALTSAARAYGCMHSASAGPGVLLQVAVSTSVLRLRLMFAPGQVTETSFSPGLQASSHRFAGPHVSRLSTCRPLDPERPRGPAGPDDPIGPGGPGGPGGPAGPRRPAGPGGPTSPFSPCGPGGPAGPWGPGGPCGPSKQPPRQRAANTATAAIAERIGRPRRLFKLTRS